ncbi:MAG: hypothetical protein Q8N63_04175 [Nanoarchaeota archaeon]|nr:hypothetical protein [Nanoarchaeota archaeon]
METTKNIKNDLLKRKEISFIMESDKNPGFEGTRKIIAEDFKSDEEAVDVYGVKGSFGSSKFKVDAYIYNSKEDLEKAKQLTQKQRTEIKKAAEDAKKAEDEAKKAEAESKKAETEAKASEETKKEA